MAPAKKNDQDKYIKMSISFEPKQFDQLMHYCETQERSASPAALTGSVGAFDLVLLNHTSII